MTSVRPPRGRSHRIQICLPAMGTEYTLRADAETFARARVALEHITGFPPQVENDARGGRLFVALDAAEHAAFGRAWKAIATRS